MGVTVKPGATAFTRTPCSAQSIASERVSAATAPLLAVYGGLRRKRDEGRLGGDVDDRPTALARVAAECLAGLERPEHVDLEVPPEVLHRELFDRLVLGQDPGGVDQDVEPVEPGRQRVERCPVGDVDRRVGGEIDDVNLRPGAQEQSTARLADPGGSARDDSDSAVQTVHVGHPNLVFMARCGPRSPPRGSTGSTLCPRPPPLAWATSWSYRDRFRSTTR